MNFSHYEISQSSSMQHVDMKICIVKNDSSGIATFVFNDQLYSTKIFPDQNDNTIWNGTYENYEHEFPFREKWGFKFNVSGDRNETDFPYSNKRLKDSYHHHIEYWIEIIVDGINTVQGNGTGTGGNTGGD